MNALEGRSSWNNVPVSWIIDSVKNPQKPI